MIIYSSKYYTKYNQIVKHYKELDLKKSKDLYTESHHIIPKSMGGSNKKDNLVRVPARVHFLLHWMLYRIYRTQGMAFAWHCMTTLNVNKHDHISKSYEYARITMSKQKTGVLHSEETKRKISISALSRVYTDEQKLSKSNKLKSRIISAETKKKISTAKKGRSNGAHSEETKRKISESHKGKIISESTKCKISAWTRSDITKDKIKAGVIKSWSNKQPQLCPYCNKLGRANMKRYHFDNCKLKAQHQPTAVDL